MTLEEFPDNTKVRRSTWRRGLYGVKTVQGDWVYIEDGKHAGKLSQNMLGYADFEYYDQIEDEGWTKCPTCHKIVDCVCKESTKNKNKVVMMENVNFVGGEYNVVAIKISRKDSYYNFKIAADIPVEEGDLVVYHSHKGMGIGTVKKAFINNFENAEEISKATAWIVNVVDQTDHLNRVKATAKREYILKQLEERKAAMEASQVYELLGSVDPIAKKLLKQLKKLS